MSLGISAGLTGFGLFEQSPLGGVIGASTCSVFKLDPFFGMFPIEPLLDFIPGVSPLRVTLDMIDNETVVDEYETTTHPIQDISDATSNVHEKLKTLTIEGTLSATLPTAPLAIPIPAIPNPGGILRIDLIRLRNLRNIQKERRPVMVVTPRYSIAQAWIGRIESNWRPELGESMSVNVTFTQAKIVAPSFGPPVASDASAQLPGNNSAVGGGLASTMSTPVSSTASATPGLPPTVTPM